MTQIRLLELHAREYYGMSDAWHAYAFRAERNPAAPEQLMYYQVVGCIAPLTTRGPNTGQPNFRRAERGTQRTAYFTPAQQEAWELAWQARTGLCRACVGDGEILVSWSVTEGRTTRPCEACQGTGSLTTQSKEIAS